MVVDSTGSIGASATEHDKFHSQQVMQAGCCGKTEYRMHSHDILSACNITVVQISKETLTYAEETTCIFQLESHLESHKQHAQNPNLTTNLTSNLTNLTTNLTTIWYPQTLKKTLPTTPPELRERSI